MPWLTREEVDAIVATALHKVADFDGPISNYKFDWFDDVLLKKFKDSIDKQLEEKKFNIELTMTTLKESFKDMGKTLDEFAEFIEINQEPIE